MDNPFGKIVYGTMNYPLLPPLIVPPSELVLPSISVVRHERLGSGAGGLYPKEL
jgi:hypothetical protein